MMRLLASSSGPTAWTLHRLPRANAIGGPSAAASKRVLLVCAHANGFCKECWHPLLEDMQVRADSDEDVDALCLDLAGHGSSAPFALPVEMDVLGKSVSSALAECLASEAAGAQGHGPQTTRIVGVGHSIGATALLNAEHAKHTFERLLLVEPIILPPGPDGVYPTERGAANPLSLATLKRRTTFGSKQEAFENWTGKGAFKFWKPELLRQFAEHALREDAPGGPVHLKCAPESEADIYNMAISIGGELGEIECPVDIMNGERSVHMPKEYTASFMPKFKHPGDFVVVPNATHFIPMEQPPVVVQQMIHSLRLPTTTLSSPAPPPRTPSPNL